MGPNKPSARGPELLQQQPLWLSTGDSFPNFNITCDDQSQSCSQGSYNALAMRRIIFGPDADGVCAATSRARRGMCDVFKDRSRVDVAYIGSGLGRAGFQGDAAPLVSGQFCLSGYDRIRWFGLSSPHRSHFNG